MRSRNGVRLPTPSSSISACSPKIEDVIPGVKVRVIGPPTLEQRPGVGGDRSRDPEYWMLHQRRLSQALNATGLDTTPKHNLDLATMEINPGRVRWLVERLRDQNIAHLARIVRELDDALNNTSLILCLDAGDKRMLLPGDAQIENWAYALKESTESDGFDSETVKAMLADVDFYKVGHHGSRNATPRTLFNLWDAPDKRDRPMFVDDVHQIRGSMANPTPPASPAPTCGMLWPAGPRSIRATSYNPKTSSSSTSKPCCRVTFLRVCRTGRSVRRAVRAQGGGAHHP